MVKAEKISDDKVKCAVPRYTKPDVLEVELTFNGQDFTNDNKTYGFFDPFVLDVQPRLISTSGSTRVRLIGFGYVNSGQLKSKIHHVMRGDFACSGNECTQSAEYIDKKTIETGTFPRSSVNFKDNNENVMQEGMAVEASVLNNVFT